MQYGIFRQSVRDGYQVEEPDDWLRQPDPWQIARPGKEFRVPLQASFELRGSSIRVIPDRPSTIIGIAHDRPVVGYGARCVNTLRLWGRDRAEDVRLRRVLARRLRRRGHRQHRGRIADARALSGRFDAGRPLAALPAGVLPGELLAAGHPVALSEARERMVGAARSRGDSAERHAPGARRRPS